jgi:sugar-specific transcriptional regulator TrmB
LIGESVKQVLREIGLSAYEVDAYFALLKWGQMTAIETSKRGNIPYSKIYEVLNSLKEKGWIKSTEQRPSKYYPMPPLEALATAKIMLEEKYKNWEQKIASELQPLYEKLELIERPDILILRGQQAIISKIEEILSKASNEIMIAAPEFTKNIITSATFFLEALQKTRAKVKLMVSGKTESWKFLQELTGVFEIRVRDKMFGGGIIVDGKEAMLFMGEDKPSLVIWSNHLGLVQFAKDYFQYLWGSSKEFKNEKERRKLGKEFIYP